MTADQWTTEQIKQALKDHLTLEVGPRSNDPEDDTRTITLFFGDEEIASADL